MYGILLKLDLCGALNSVNNCGTKDQCAHLDLEKQFTNSENLLLLQVNRLLSLVFLIFFFVFYVEGKAAYTNTSSLKVGSSICP